MDDNLVNIFLSFAQYYASVGDSEGRPRRLCVWLHGAGARPASVQLPITYFY